jgi:hypothetical protein
MQESQKAYVQDIEVKVGQIWELRNYGIRIEITSVDRRIKGTCIQSGPMWSVGEDNEWYLDGDFWDDEPCQHDLFKLVQDVEIPKDIPTLTLSEKIAIMQAAQNGAVILVDGVPTKVEDCTWDWSNHSYKVDTRKNISYRVALMCRDGQNYATLLHSQDTESMFRANPIFIRWLTDWNTVYIDEDDKA